MRRKGKHHTPSLYCAHTHKVSKLFKFQANLTSTNHPMWGAGRVLSESVSPRLSAEDGG